MLTGWVKLKEGRTGIYSGLWTCIENSEATGGKTGRAGEETGTNNPSRCRASNFEKTTNNGSDAGRVETF
jgi:hypothetical protein